ncbi:heparan-alpha-glucosaminide N-acetyltransferase domain-containing protein [Streptomyces flavofungini]|uniref:heparan-alpha-glucosaminide N-acetyltransferase domain-containing protein n=1 Tax=Streptomyces flavofungini TaxID=68200 RepID=UPI00339D58A8
MTMQPRQSVTAPPATDAPALAHRDRHTTTGRLLGVDLARGLAVFGMYAAHVGPAPEDAGGVIGFLLELSHGRSSALFAFLAGFSLILLTGRSTPRTGRAGRRAVLHVLIRAVVLLALGTALTMTGTPVEVILAYYGLFFALLLPLYRLRPRALAALAVATAITLPQVRYLLLRSLDDTTWGETLVAHDPLARISDTGGFLDLFVTGSYPALAWLSFLLAGMAVARLDLASRAVRARLAVTGAALAVVGHGGS